jgi:hypothetical protein
LALGSGDLAVNLQEVEAVREEPDPVRALAQEIGDEVPARAEYAF